MLEHLNGKRKRTHTHPHPRETAASRRGTHSQIYKRRNHTHTHSHVHNTVTQRRAGRGHPAIEGAEHSRRSACRPTPGGDDARALARATQDHAGPDVARDTDPDPRRAPHHSWRDLPEGRSLNMACGRAWHTAHACTHGVARSRCRRCHAERPPSRRARRRRVPRRRAWARDAPLTRACSCSPPRPPPWASPTWCASTPGSAGSARARCRGAPGGPSRARATRPSRPAARSLPSGAA